MGILDMYKRLRGKLSTREAWSPRTYGSTAGAYDCVLDDQGMATGSTALRVSTVWRCVRLLSESVSNLPLLYQRKHGQIFTTDTDNPLHYLFNVQPDETMSACDFWRQLVTNVLLQGNAYVVPFYDHGSQYPYRLALCGPGTVSHDTDRDLYTVCDYENGIAGTFSESEIIHVKGPTLYSHKQGVSVLTFARLAVQIAGAGDRETLNRFVNGGAVRGIVSNGTRTQGFGEYQDDELQKVAEDIDGLFRSGRRIVSVPGEVSLNVLSMSSTDMQFLESRKFSVLEICRFFGVNPSFVFADTSTNYKSAEQANVGYLTNTLNPVLRNIENEFGRKLIDRRRAGRVRLTFDRRSLYECDLASKVNYQAKTIAAGIYTVNEWRAEEGHTPVESGDTVLVSANLRSIDELTGGGAPAQTKNNKGDNQDQDQDQDKDI